MGAAGKNIFRGKKPMITTTAQAKVNLTLEVLKKRPDGFHDIRSVVQTFEFNDKLRLQAGAKIEYKCNLPQWSAAKSLVSKTVDLLRNSYGSRQGVVVEIEKRIPLSSGLGGDSSDAAALLKGLNLLWNLKLSQPDLLKIAAQLGSDVSLFLYGGTVLAEGRGEKIRPLHPMPRMSVVLLLPHIPKPENKTQQMYAQLNVRHYTAGTITEGFINMLEGRATGLKTGLYNVFDEIGLNYFSGLKEYKQKFLDAGALEVHLAGSGPTLFTLNRDEIKAIEIQKRLHAKGLDSYLAEF
jgi:4-diphosphocytidyl-2-C-methyl-D-erythritol kinase